MNVLEMQSASGNINTNFENIAVINSLVTNNLETLPNDPTSNFP